MAVETSKRSQNRLRTRAEDTQDARDILLRRTPAKSKEMLSRDTKDGSRRPLPSIRWPRRPSSNDQRSTSPISILQRTILVILFMAAVLGQVEAVLINFENCLDQNTINSNPLRLQWTPSYVDAVFDMSAMSHNLNVTIYGNVSGTANGEPPPPESEWTDPNSTVGKILDLSPTNDKYSTLFTTFNVLSYTPYASGPTRFCNTTFDTECPIAPVPGTINQSDPLQYPAFTVSHDLFSTYAFTTVVAMMKLETGDASAAVIACVSAPITPALGTTIDNLLTYLPLFVLILVGIATASAAVFSPWGTWDLFRWTSNYGRDPDQLRLITPGFGDCLQYIQFIFLSGSLSLNYPGFYPVVVSRVGWSSLMFNQSFVSHGPGLPSIEDGIYIANGTFGLDTMSQLVGMASDIDVWAGMMVWLLAILAALVIIIEIGFVCQWAYRHISNTQEEDLRNKNLPLSAGNVIRVVFNYFLLPIVAFSMYQFVIADHSSAVTVGLAALTLAALIGFSGWLFWVIVSSRPRSYLFDDLPTVLLYGPLYNTYSDNAATYALVPVLLTFVRGIAIGAIQPSGIAQLVVLAICEVVFILTLNAFRPFHSPTSMNAFHTVFAVVRLSIVLLMVAFVPSLGVDDSPRGWIGYVILLMHALTLFVGFFIHALQTLIEVIARRAGAGGDENGATRGGLVKAFGMRQLSRRTPRTGRNRNSMASDSAILNADNDRKSVQFGERSRSMSANSAALLSRPMLGDRRQSAGLDSVSVPGASYSNAGSGGGGLTPTTPGGVSAFSYIPGANQSNGQGGILSLRSNEPTDPYYRPPRARRVTMELVSPNMEFAPATRSRSSWNGGELAKRWSNGEDGSPDPMEGPSISGRGTPLPAHLGGTRERADSNADDSRRAKTDYATREVDYYYGVRGPALSNMPTRRLKTGPADPTGPVSSATGWFRNLFGGKSKEKGKGFEVVRSARAPPGLGSPTGEISLADQMPYKDNPDHDGQRRVSGPRKFSLDDETDAVGAGTRRLPSDRPSPMTSDVEDDDDDENYVSDEETGPRFRRSQLSPVPPTLPDIETAGAIEMPSRIASKASSKHSRAGGPYKSKDVGPALPRKSSKRLYGNSVDLGADETTRLSVIAPSPPSTPGQPAASSNWPLQPGTNAAQRLPFESSHSASSHSRGPSLAESAVSALTVDESDPQGHPRHSSSALGMLAPSFRDDRPSSVGFVQQHRASDGIHVVHSNEQIIHGGSTAELVDEPLRSHTPEPLGSH